ncbi:MAG: VCBS repeat-containing protein, partial [Myxococcales bacterium]|nr:VCBS repeat-containing protein [Myxococcales bacterium]
DLDGDGDLDLVIAARGMNRPLYFENDGHGVFTDVAATKLVDAPIADTLGMAAGDVDGDGDIDVFVPVFDAPMDYLLRNDGHGVLTRDATAVTEDGSVDHAAAMGDLDGDGDLDIVTAGWGAPERVLLNDGKGVFTVLPGAIPARAEPTPGLALADLDGDGHLDIVVTTNSAEVAPIRAYLGKGDGTFEDAPANTFGQNTIPSARRPAVADIDGDGELDIAVASTASYDVYVAAEGRYLWASSTLGLPVEMNPWNAVATADMDLDGDVDVLFGGEGVPTRLFMNDGTGQLTSVAARMPADVRSTLCLVVADFNGDGAPDILTTEGATSQTDILFSDGN